MAVFAESLAFYLSMHSRKLAVMLRVTAAQKLSKIKAIYCPLKPLMEASLVISCRTKRTSLFPGFIKIILGFRAESSQWFKRQRYSN